ncbi:MAG: hypothetical protein DMF57_17565 [Acidobacteria bacterium]|nr:MAG: hypothetical protein DMF57_17565 [Acidobacteriota bacterium]
MESLDDPSRIRECRSKRFQKSEQSLMDDSSIRSQTALSTSEEGLVMNREQFLAGLRPLPTGLTGGIAVKELAVQEFPSFAVVRFVADEWERVFGQRRSLRRPSITWRIR